MEYGHSLLGDYSFTPHRVTTQRSKCQGSQVVAQSFGKVKVPQVQDW